MEHAKPCPGPPPPPSRLRGDVQSANAPWAPSIDPDKGIPERERKREREGEGEDARRTQPPHRLALRALP